MLIFPDNTVLINFALVGQVDLFEALVGDNGSWTYTISEECSKSAQMEGLSSLTRMHDILGEPLYPSRAERIDMLLIRERLALPNDPASKHLGEAEAIAILSKRELDAIFVTDDGTAKVLAVAEVTIKAICTADLFRLAVRTGRVSFEVAWQCLGKLRLLGRGVGGKTRSEVEFRAWCEVI